MTMTDRRFAWLLVALAASSGLATARPPSATPAPAPTTTSTAADFKLVVRWFGVGDKPRATAELVARGGVVYQFLAESPGEILVIEPAAGRVTLFDLRRRVLTELSAKRLDAGLARLHRRTAEGVDRQGKSEAKADRVAAAAGRDLIEPRFAESYDPAAHSIRLTNPTVEIDARGEPEPDGGRLLLVANALAATVKVDVLRDPENLTAFTRLDALRRLVADRRLRPTELSALYRLTGPPQRARWTYRLVPALTDREREALTRIDAARTQSKAVGFEEYERPAGE